MKHALVVVALAVSYHGPGALSVDAGQARQPPGHAQLVIVVDGLRPDYVTPDVMPRLFRLGQRGVVFGAHHSVFPTVTRVNASSLVTGAYPETHGLMGNDIYIPRANATQSLDTGQRENLEAVERAEGQLLTAPTLSQVLHQRGRTLLAVSSGSSGGAYLLNHPAGNGATIHTEFVYPPELTGRVAERLGRAPAHSTPNDAQNQYAIDAFLKVGLDDVHPDVTLMWLNDPDGTAHANGIGAPITRRALMLVDGGIGRIEDALAARGVLDRTNIFVTSDHGFSTHIGTFELAALVEPFARTRDDGSKDIVIAEGAVYLRAGPDAARTAAIVAALQQRPEVGAVFSRAGPGGGAKGAVPGTLSFGVARWSHARSGDILVSANWSDDANEAGFRGKTTQGGVAGHGTSSPFDIHNTLIAAGPDIREHAVSHVPTATVDLAPTLLRLLGLPPAPTMTGRAIVEALRNGPTPASVRIEQLTETVTTLDRHLELSAHISIVAGYRYLDYTEVKRR